MHGIRIIDVDHTVRYINSAFEKLSGLKKNEVIGNKCWELFPGSFCHTPDCSLKKIAGGEKALQVEGDRVRPDGTRVTCLVSISPLYSPDGRFVGIMESFRDSTRRNELQGQLDEFEDRYRALVELSGEVGESILMLQDIGGREGIITFASEQFFRMTGYTRQELSSKPLTSLLSPRERQASISRHRRKMKGESLPGLYEVGIIRKDGLQVPCELTSAVTQYKGQPANVIYLRDITERKNLQKALADEKDKFQSLFEEAPAAIWEMDYSRVKECIDSLGSQGITGLKQYFDSNPCHALDCLRLGRIIGVNKEAVSLWEAESRQDLCSGILDLLSKRPTGLARELENIVAFARGDTEVTYDMADPTFKGNWKYLHVKYYLLPGHEDTWSRVLASFTDITRQKQAEERLKAYQGCLEEIVSDRTEQLKKAESRLKELLKIERQLRRDIQDKMVERIEFTRALVHELKTPLTPLMACSEALSSTLTDEPQTSLARNVNIGASRLSKKVDDLIDLARGEVGILHLKCRRIDPQKMLREVLDYVSENASRKNLEINLDAPQEMEKIKADKERLIQVLLNLLDNAIKYTPPPGKIHIKARQENSWLFIEVSDTGIGISEEQRKYLFQPYKRFSSTKGRVGGLGLGLVLSKFIVEAHGGSILVNSSGGSGSTFIIKVPVSPSSSASTSL